jgi:acetoin utilization protein AcuB
MKREKVRRLPVVESGGKLLGIISEKDILNASPSDATSLSVWEISYLISKITVDRVMTKHLITVTEDTPLEEAARIMADNKIGALPVVRGSELIGIITETDLFKIFLELLGAREPGVRMEVLLHDEPGKLHQFVGAVRDLGGNIIALGTFLGESAENRLVTIKVDGITADDLEAAVTGMVDKIVDIRET